MSNISILSSIQKTSFEFMLNKNNMGSYIQELNPITKDSIFNIYSEVNKTGEKIETVAIRKLGNQYSVVVKLVNEESKRIYHCAISNFKTVSEKIKNEIESFFQKLQLV